MISTISLAMCTETLLKGDTVPTIWATTFVWSFTILVMVIKEIHAHAATEAIRAAGQDDIPIVFDKAKMQALLTYFVLGPSNDEEAHHGDEAKSKIDKERGYSKDGGEKVGDITGKRNVAPFSPTPPPSVDEPKLATPGRAPTIEACEVWRNVQDGRERSLASAAETVAVTIDTDAHETSSSDDLQPAGALTQHTREDASTFREGSCGSACSDIEKGSARLDSSEWYTTEACIVCFSEYSIGDRLCRMPCGHTYHAACIDEWLDRAEKPCCPLCKIDLREDLSATGAIVARSSEGAVMDSVDVEAV